jgi:hypothetical protein
MRKPEQLRRLLLRAVPGLADAPERLALYVDEGRIAARAGASLSFEYRYTANLVIQDYAGDRNAVVVPLLAWIAEAEPDLLAKPDSEPFTFEAELLQDDAVDLSITLQLTERVAVVPGADGGYEVRHLDEPPADADRFDGICGVILRRLHLDDVSADIVTPIPA